MKYFFTLLPLFFTVFLQAQSGTLDKTYGSNNTGEVSIFNNSYIKAAAIQSDDKLILGGYDSTLGLDYGFALIRHNKDGSIDTKFGNSGQVNTSVNDLVKDLRYSSGWTSIAVQKDGKIIVAGNIGWNNPDYPKGNSVQYDIDIVVARFLPDGTTDESFGSHGRVVTNLDYLEYINSVAVQPDGKIVVSGFQNTDIFGNGNGVLLVRYNSDGSLDAGFGNYHGYTLYDQERGTYGYSLLLQPEGNIIVGGTAIGDGAFLLIRYLPTGKLDQSFGSLGTVKTSFGSGTSSSISSLAMDDKGRICATGTLNNNEKVLVARYLPDGELDNSFDKDGRAELSYNSIEYKYVLSNIILTQPENKLVVSSLIAGNVDTAYTLVLTGLNDDGTKDASFGTDAGQTVTDIEFDNNSSIVDAVMQSDDKIIVSGSKTQQQNTGNPPTYSYLLNRFNGYPVHVSLAVKIKRFVHNHNITWNSLPTDDKIASYAVEQSNNSRSNFLPIAKLSGRSNLADYSFTNAQLLQGTNYYRIKAVSIDGTIRYSEVVSADNIANSASVYPNPAKSSITVQGLPNNETANISIKDGSGTVLSKGVSNGSTQYRSSLANLQPGTYYINITTTNKTETLPFVKE